MEALSHRFASALYKGLWETTFKGRAFNAAVTLAGLVVFLARLHLSGGVSWHNARTHGGEGLTIALFVLCFLIAGNAIRAAFVVSRDIHHEANLPPPPIRYLPLVSATGSPIPAGVEERITYSHPYLKLSGMALTIVCGCAVASYLAWEKTIQLESENQSTEPVDRANLHALGAEIDVHIPTEQDIAAVEAQGPKLPNELGIAWLMRGTTPQAFITMQNVGRNRVLAPFVVRAAMIISEPLSPFQEDELFKKRPEWGIGGDLSFGNDWYPSDPPHRVHTHYAIMLSRVQDWKQLIHGNKVFYVVTRSLYKDKDGPLPESVSCRWFSISQSKSHGLCATHNN